MTWAFYYPDNGETKEDARTPRDSFVARGPECVAEYAVEEDWTNDGWERNQNEFDIVVIDENGKETKFKGWSEPDIRHCVREA